MNRNALIGGLGGVALGLAGCAGDTGMQQSLVAPQAGPYANAHDRARGADYARRDADWRFGPIVYQVLVDRFAPSANLGASATCTPRPGGSATGTSVRRAGSTSKKRGSGLTRLISGAAISTRYGLGSTTSRRWARMSCT
ncbi:MAG: hypothetical protein ACFHWZ_01345 [Phycisphaerales bacterium]